MPRMARQMALTAELVARVHRIVEDTGPEPDRVYHTEQDYDAAVAESLASHSAGEDAWLFAYGSLIWKPEVDHVEERIGTARGWRGDAGGERQTLYCHSRQLPEGKICYGLLLFMSLRTTETEVS